MTRRPKIIAIGGFASNTGKTSLLCDLIRAFPGWEAIKTTRGHYRSCGKDPHACCVSGLLGEEPVIYSGHEQTFTAGKDTGRYWEAGAGNVHWLVATDAQVEMGIRETLARVNSDGVFIEGNSFSEYVAVDAMILTVRESQTNIKRSAKRALLRATALYVWRDVTPSRPATEIVAALAKGDDELVSRVSNIPSYTSESFSDLLLCLRQLNQQAAA